MARRHRPSMRALHWDEAKHPRDDRGRFAHKGGGKWLGKALKQVEARFGDIHMGAAPGQQPRGRLATGVIDTKSISRGAPRIEARSPLGPVEAPGGRVGRSATGVLPKGTFDRGPASASSSHIGVKPTAAQVKAGDHVRIQGEDVYGRRITMNGYAGNPTPVRVGSGRRKGGQRKRDMLSIGISEQPDGGGRHSQVLIDPGATVERTEPSAEMKRLEGVKPTTGRTATGVDKSRVSTQASTMGDTRRAGADATGKERSALARTAGGVLSPQAAPRHNAAAMALQEDRQAPTPEVLAERLRRHGLDSIAKDVEAGRYRKAEDALHKETTSGRLSRATFEKRNDARAVYNDLTRMQEPQNAEDFGGRTVVKSGSGWAVRGNDEDRKALGGAYLYTTKTKADAEDWARTHTAAQRAMREGRHEDAARISREREAALVGGEGRAYRPQGSVAMVPAGAAQERAKAFRASNAVSGSPAARDLVAAKSDESVRAVAADASREAAAGVGHVPASRRRALEAQARTGRTATGPQLRTDEFGFPQTEGPARPPVSHEERRAASLATRDGIPPKDGRPDITALATSNSKNDFHRWSLSTSKGRDATMAPDVARTSGGVLDGKPASAVVMNPKDGTGDYRYQIIDEGTGNVLEEGSGHDAGEVFAKADRIFSSQRSQGMARTAGNEVHYEARSKQRPKDISRGDWGSGPFHDFSVVEVDKNGNEREVVKTNSMDRAFQHAAEMNSKEAGATERAAAALAASRNTSMADIYNRHSGLTREQFDALPADQRERVLNDLRKVRDSKEQVSSTIASNRSGFYGATLRGTKNAPHVDAAQAKIRELTYTAPEPVDLSINGRAGRLLSNPSRSQARNDLSGLTIAQLDELARQNNWGGYSMSWKRDKMVEFLTNRAVAGDVYKGGSPGRVAEALPHARSSEQAAAILDAAEAEHGLTKTDLASIAQAVTGHRERLTGDKRQHMRDVVAIADAHRAAPAAPAADLPGPSRTNVGPSASNADGGNFAAEVRGGLGSGDQLARETAPRAGRVAVGERVDLKPSAGSYATSGTVRSVHGEGNEATYEVDAVDQVGHRTTLYLSRRDFTARKPEGRTGRTATGRVAGVRQTRSTSDAAEVLQNATTREEANAALEGMTVVELRDVARKLNRTLAGVSTKDEMRQRLVESTVGSRINSDVLRRNANGPTGRTVAGALNAPGSGFIEPPQLAGGGKYARLSDQQIRNALEMRGTSDPELVAEAIRRGIPVNPGKA